MKPIKVVLENFGARDHIRRVGTMPPVIDRMHEGRLGFAVFQGRAITVAPFRSQQLPHYTRLGRDPGHDTGKEKQSILQTYDHRTLREKPGFPRAQKQKVPSTQYSEKSILTANGLTGNKRIRIVGVWT
jgi:hypothetical protein